MHLKLTSKRTPLTTAQSLHFMKHLCTQDEDGNWDGLVGELVNRRADIAVGAIRWVRDMSYLVRDTVSSTEYCAV